MIKYLLFLLILSIPCGSLCLAADFRDTEWGMSQDQVKSLEKTESVYPKKDTLTFKGKVAGNTVDIIYEFNDNKLKSGTYIFNERNINNNVYIQDYDKINEILDSKYGQPDSRKIIWRNDLYKEKKGFYSYAVSIGHLEFKSIWNKDKTTIIHKITGVNNIIEHSILYGDKTLIKEMPEKKEIEQIKGL